jgi:hypothetical protein
MSYLNTESFLLISERGEWGFLNYYDQSIYHDKEIGEAMGRTQIYLLCNMIVRLKPASYDD